MSTPSPTAVTQGSGFATAYPFIRPSDDVRGLLTDFYLSYLDGGCDIELPLRIDWLYGFGTDPASAPSDTPTPVNAREVVVKDAAGTVVFDSTQGDYDTQAWGNRLIVEWRAGGQVCRLVRQDVVAGDWPTTFRPADGDLDARTCQRLPSRLTGLAGVESGKVEFLGGYNVGITVNEPARVDGGRRVTRLVFDAVPGLGLGVKDGCEDAEVLIRRINGQGPDSSGDFKLDLSGCYRAQLPVTATGSLGARTAAYGGFGLTTEEAEHGLVLSNDCQPCCPCDDYVNTYKALSRVWDFWQTAAASLEEARDDYVINRNRWIAAKACFDASTARLVMAIEPECSLQVSGNWVNPTTCCVGPVELRFTFSGPADGVAGEAEWQGRGTDGRSPTEMQGTWPIFKKTFLTADPGGVSLVRFRVRIPDCVAAAAIDCTLSVHVPDADCALATASVPGYASAAWTTAGDSPPYPTRAADSKTAALNAAERTPRC